MTSLLNAGFVPLLDAAPLIVAQRLGFAEAERLDLRLHRAPNWSLLRDMLACGQVDAAQMLSVVPVAGRLGLGGVPADFEAPMVLSLGGQVIGLSPALATRLQAVAGRTGFADAAAARAAFLALPPAPIRFGVPFPFSMHVELLRLWLGDLPQIATQTVPPPMMAEAMAAGEIDAFCVGEPWGSYAVARGRAELLLAGSAIWPAAPEKVLATRTGWAGRHPEAAGRLLRAVWRACRWLSRPESRSAASDMLARPDALNIEAEVIERALQGRFDQTLQGPVADCAGFVEFSADHANYPWPAQAGWIGAQLAARHGLDRAEAQAAAQAVWRPDLYRLHLGDEAPQLPCANHSHPSQARSRFFDGRFFDLSGEN